MRGLLPLSLALAVVPAAAGIFPENAFSDKAAGTTAAAFLRLPPGARAQALGGAYVAAVDNSEAMFWNPAGLVVLEEGRSEASFSYNALLETSYAGSAAYARPFSKRRGVLGAALVYFSQGAIQGYTTQGDPSSSFTPNDMAFSLGYAKPLGRLGLGAAVKVIRSSIESFSGTTFALDLGVQARRVTEVGEGGLDLGASIQNLGPALQIGSASDPLPFAFRGGALWHISPYVNGLLDGHLPVDSDPYASLGIEGHRLITEGLHGAVRLGYNARSARGIDGLTGLSAGFGVDLARARLDYAWVPLGDLGTTHRISIGVRF